MCVCDDAVPVPEASALLARFDKWLSRAERFLAAGFDPDSRHGALYLGMVELSGEMRAGRLTFEGLGVLLAAERASVLAELAAEEEAARVPCPVVRLSG